jgi:hypothetical protein
MKIESIGQVKSTLNRIVSCLTKEGSVVITKNGRVALSSIVPSIALP